MTRRFAVLYTSVWVLFTALYAVMILSSSPNTIFTAVRAAVFTVLPAALLGLLVWQLCRAMPWSNQRPGFFAIHIAAGVLYAAIWSGITVAEIALYTPKAVLEVYVSRALGWQTIMGLLTYVVIAGVAYVIEVTTRLSEQRALASKAELQALRAQLNPHFLFNTLHSITALVCEDPAAVENALIRFGALLRYVLDAGKRDEDATVEDEVEFARKYLALEQLRLGDRLKLRETIDPEALECLIPALTLQPLVENAVRHGIAPRRDGGEIGIVANLVDDRLVLEVRDNGNGADGAAVDIADGLGLSLVRKRIAARFGGSGSTKVETAPGRGFSVVIAVPAQSTRPAASGAENVVGARVEALV